MSVPTDGTPRASRPWWRGAALYQIYPRSFADTNGDGVGDLAGVTAHLDHVVGLGVDGIWLSPFFTSPMADFGYDVADYRAVDPVFGTLADFDALVARAHALGLKVVIDQIYAHSSDAHAWFAESRRDRVNAKADWYVWADPKPDGTPPSNWLSVFGGPTWTWDGRRQQYYMHNFLAAQPQLNVRLPAVQDALLDVARFWLARGVDGFRLDAINFAMHDPALADNPVAPRDAPRSRPFDYQLHLHNQSQPEIPAFLERLRAVLDDHGGRFTVAEVGGIDPDPEMKLYTAGDRRLNTAYGFGFLDAIALTPGLVATALSRWPDTSGTGWPSWAFENHDVPRALSRWAKAAADPRERAALARVKMLLLACLRGNIFLYQGEELGLTQVDVPFDRLRDPEAILNWPHILSRDGARTPMPWRHDVAGLGFSNGRPWLPFGPDHAALAVDLQEADEASLLHLTRRCLALRRAHDALRLGDMTILAADDTLLAFERRLDGARLLCLFNLGGASRLWQPEEAAGWTMVERVGDGADWTLEEMSGLVAAWRD